MVVVVLLLLLRLRLCLSPIAPPPHTQKCPLLLKLDMRDTNVTMKVGWLVAANTRARTHAHEYLHSHFHSFAQGVRALESWGGKQS